jgi:DNA replication protein DnaC
MPYSAEVLRRARQTLAQKKADAESESNQRVYEAYAKVPRLKQIDLELRRSMTLAAQTVFTKGGDAVAAMEEVKQANLALQQERAKLVAEQFAPGWLDGVSVCDRCGGNGYIGSAMCGCLRELCRQEQKAQLRQLTGGQERFDTFRLDYYSDLTDPRYGASPRFIMERNLKICQRFTDAFSEGIGNLLFVGNTGLGKTFLSACIANAVTDKGYSVAYESAPQLFAKLEKNRFSPDEESRRQAEELAACDLLIIDDLGTELPGNFVTAALYSLLSDRLLSGKSMLVSTNLNVEEMAKRYSPQIASRFEGNFKGLTFVGEDIRVLKNRGL